MPLGRAGSIPAQRTKNRPKAVFVFPVSLYFLAEFQILPRPGHCPVDHSFLSVLKLKGKYSGQKDIRLVNTKMIPRTSRITPKAPLTVPLKYR